MKVAVIGITGMTGGPVADELLSRGHYVTGISRNPFRVAARDGLWLQPADVMDIKRLGEVIADHDAVVTAYSPGHGMGPQIYKYCVEAAWRIKRAFKQVNGRYLIHVGGASSLFAQPGVQMFEDPRWPHWYFDTATPEHLRYLGATTGNGLFGEVADYREANSQGLEPGLRADTQEERLHDLLSQKMAQGPDIAQGCRAQFELFEHDLTFRWSFVSPPWFYRPGPRSGRYRTVVGTLPMEGDRPATLFVPDLAVAIADEVEAQRFVHEHWSVARLDVA